MKVISLWLWMGQTLMEAQIAYKAPFRSSACCLVSLIFLLKAANKFYYKFWSGNFAD